MVSIKYIQVSYTEAFAPHTFRPIPLLLDILKTDMLLWQVFDQKVYFMAVSR